MALLASCGGGSAPTAPVITPPVTPPAASPFTIVAAGIDSLTDGTVTSWRTYFAQNVRGGLGDGGPGWLSVTSPGGGGNKVTNEGARLTLTGNLVPFNIASPDARLSIDGYGASTAAAAAGTGFSLRPATYWKQARLYYLKQPGGGTMRCGNGSIAVASGTLIDTAATANDLGAVDIFYAAAAGGDSFGCGAMTGKIAVYGALVTLDRGLVMADWAGSGRQLQEVAAQDSTMRRKWFAAIKPDFYLLNGGINDDCHMRSATLFEADLRMIVGDIAAASSATKQIMVQPNDKQNDDPGGILCADYVAARMRVAADTGYPFADIRSIFGTYPQANAAGLMEDTTHPNGQGNRLIGAFLAKATGLASTAPDPGPTPYPM